MKFSLTDEEFNLLRKLLETSAGLVHDESRRDSLTFAVAGRMEASGASSPAVYLAMLSGPGGASERQQLIDVVTIQETHFFRNPPQIRALRQHVLPELIRRSTALNRPLTIWSAGCSTGEEPYSLAMLVRELMPMATREHVRIVGSDVSATALAFADAGRYGARAVQMADPIDLGRWFDIDHGSYSVKDDVRELVDLQLHNLITEAPPFDSGEVDLLLCRNVTIYFNRTTTKALMSRFHTTLGDGGYLFLGHSETLWQMSEAFTLVPLGDAFVYRRDDGPQGRATLPDRRTEAGDAPILLPERRGRTERRRDLPETPSAPIKTAPAVPPQRVRRASEPARQEVARSASHRPADRRASPRSAAAASATGASAQELVATAREALAKGRYCDAVGAAGRAAKADPMLVEPHLIGGEALVNLGRDADAVRELRQAVYLQPDSASALILLAGALDRQGEPAAAGRAYRAAAATVGDLPAEEVSAFFGGRSAAELVDLCLRLATQAERTAKATKSARFRTRETP
ncbi:MAG TPA: CheR family methyltransferase [Acidothermaceae bacterium]|nr:CheR family methyltransferase [Acidothermaceae bacterium]